MPEQIALKFPAGTRDRLKSLAGPRESMTAVILRGLDALSQPTGRSEESSQIADLSARVAALERQLAGSNVSRELATQAGAGDGRHYTQAERALAVLLDQQGKRPVEIRCTLLAQFGRAPSPRSIRRQLNAWKADLADS